MKALTFLAALAVAVLIAAIAVPEFFPGIVPAGYQQPLQQIAAYQREMTLAALAVAILLVLLVAVLIAKKPARPPVRAQAPQPPQPAPANQAEAELVTLLAILQEKGRLIDFLMDDVTSYDDRQVGAAARVVHSGCRSALQEHFTIRPIRDEAEGSVVTVNAGYAADEYRLVGKISGEAPFQGKLIHRGWRAETVKLPRVLNARRDRLPSIAPAEVELR